MRIVVQRVTKASVAVAGKTVGAIDHGLCVLVGIATGDTRADAEYILRKLLGLRLFNAPDGKAWAKNVMDVDGGVLLVSQFTLCHVLKGNKPDFHNAMKTADAQALFETIVADAGAAYRPDRIATGAFGAYMQVAIDNDGPVTLVIDSKEKDGGGAKPASPATPSTSDTPASA